MSLVLVDRQWSIVSGSFDIRMRFFVSFPDTNGMNSVLRPSIPKAPEMPVFQSFSAHDCEGPALTRAEFGA
jgi:hypothetical protein